MATELESIDAPDPSMEKVIEALKREKRWER